MESSNVLAFFPSEPAIERITSVTLDRMADFATRADAFASYTPADIVAAVIAEPNGDVARFLAGVIAKSIELVAVLDCVEAA